MLLVAAWQSLLFYVLLYRVQQGMECASHACLRTEALQMQGIQKHFIVNSTACKHVHSPSMLMGFSWCFLSALIGQHWSVVTSCGVPFQSPAAQLLLACHCLQDPLHWSRC